MLDLALRLILGLGLRPGIGSRPNMLSLRRSLPGEKTRNPCALGKTDCAQVRPANDFHVMFKGLCDFLLVINSNIGLISYRLAAIHP